MRILLTAMLAATEIDELRRLCSGVGVLEEAGATYYLLSGLELPSGCSPNAIDALLCPTARDGYPSRLFFSLKPSCNIQRNWNATGIRIGERNWHAFSWKVPGENLTAVQILLGHLSAIH